MRYALAALAFFVSPALAENKLPDKECDRAFVRTWQRDQETGIKMLPKKACLMRTGKGDYVCYPGGCASAYVYSDLDADALGRSF